VDVSPGADWSSVSCSRAAILTPQQRPRLSAANPKLRSGGCTMTKIVLVALCTALFASSAPALAARSGSGSGSAGGTADGGTPSRQNQTWQRDSGHGSYQQRARFLGNGPP